MSDPRPPVPAPAALPEAETMRRMFAGTVHNLGNIVTVARLAANELSDGHTEAGKVLDMMLGEMLPTIKTELAAGRIASFLGEHPIGREYVAAMHDLLAAQQRLVLDQQATVDNLTKKLDHLSQILALEQQMLTGLGQPEVVSLSQLGKDALLLMHEALIRHKVHTEVHFETDAGVSVEPGLVVQVFVNLIKNSVEALDEIHTHPRKLTLRTRLDAKSLPHEVVCTCTDNGPGIAPAVLPQLFEFGFTTKGRRHGGQGVGLHYCRRTLEKYRGTISATSVFGQGATFTFRLPAHPAPAAGPA